MASQTASVATYECTCENSIAVVNCKFRAYSSSGEKGKEIDQRSFTTGHLTLPDETGNIVKIGYWDVNWQLVGCFGPVNNGDSIKVDGAMNDFKVMINGHPATPVPCPKD